MSSNYPPGETGGGSCQPVPHCCPKCGHKAVIAMQSELGGMFYLKDDAVECPKCREDLEPVDPETERRKIERPRAKPSAGLATVLGLAAALSGDLEGPPGGPAIRQAIRHGERCCSCGEVGGHQPGCKPPRAFKRV